MVVDEKLQRKIIKEISRITHVIRDDNAPVEGMVLSALIIDMLASILLDRITVEDFMEIMIEYPAPIIKYYVEFFKTNSHA